MTEINKQNEISKRKKIKKQNTIIVFIIIVAFSAVFLYIFLILRPELSDDGLGDESLFIIDGNAKGIDAHNWTWAEQQDWCNGSGTWGDPYVIENLTINGEGSSDCIQIRNSIVYFIIRNCTFYNSGGFPASGISLFNVRNGQLINNTSSNNDRFGLELYKCNNNTVSGNKLKDNKLIGIYIVGDYNNISKNIINNTDESGIILENSTNCFIKGNILNNNKVGIDLYGSNDNIVSGNNLTGNEKCIVEHCCKGNIYENNGDCEIIIYECNVKTPEIPWVLIILIIVSIIALIIAVITIIITYNKKIKDKSSIWKKKAHN